MNELITALNSVLCVPFFAIKAKLSDFMCLFTEVKPEPAKSDHELKEIDNEFDEESAEMVAKAVTDNQK